VDQALSTQPSINTLVIGGGGYIGSHLVPKLIASGRDVTVVGRSKTPRYSLPDKASYISGDFSQYELISSLVERNQEVVLLAYATVPNTSFEDPLADLLQNLPAAVQLFTLAAQREAKLLLVSSGGTVYGNASRLPISENHSTNPISPYGVTKLTLENYAYLYAAIHGLKFVCVRPANAYGPGQRPFTGQGFIATAMASAMKGLPVRIFGKRGTIRDYLYITDLAEGLLTAFEKGELGQTYNLGSGIGLSNMDLLDAMKPIMSDDGCRIGVEHLPERSFDVKANVLDSTKLMNLTGWQPKIPIKQGLRLTKDWLSRELGPANSNAG